MRANYSSSGGTTGAPLNMTKLGPGLIAPRMVASAMLRTDTIIFHLLRSLAARSLLT
jgi:hypothetical protein